MTKLLKLLKPFIWTIIVLVGLLVVQAMCDLALPSYTSDIVNVGIQEGGIESAVPNVVRESKMQQLQLFMNQEEIDKVENVYQKLEESTLTGEELADTLKKYPELANEALYELKTSDKDVINDLETIFVTPMMNVNALESESEQTEQIKAQLVAVLPPEAVLEDSTLLDLVSLLPKEQLAEMMSQMQEQFSKMPESILVQGAHAFVKNEYTQIGINTEKIQSDYIWGAGVKMLLIALLSMAISIAVGFVASRVGASVGRNLRKDVFRKVVSFSNSEFDRFSTASLITRSTNDIQQVQMVLVLLLRIVCYAPILGIGGIIKVLGTNTEMVWIIGVAVLAIMVVVVLLFSFVMPKFKMIQKLIDKLNLVTREILTGIPVIRAFGTEKHEEKRFDNANTELTKTNLFVNRIMTCMMPLMMLIMNGITLLIMWNGAHSISEGQMQVGDLMAFIQYTMQIIMAFLMISMVSVMLPRAAVSATRVDEVIETRSAIIDPNTSQTAKTEELGIVEFRDVSFRYPNAEENVLDNISFVAKPGETTAFIGSTGSGKSTLINLIPRFYDVTEGEVLVDGVNVRNQSQYDLHDKIGYVPQKGVLFSGTIESNLKYGDQEISDEAMKTAAEIAQASDFIAQKEKTFLSEITQGGTNVSGGQKQRLSIARAIAKGPEIYIFDDSFSALDYKTDITLRNALKHHTKNSTVLIVAQRISTILHADQIIVLDEGRIIDKGTHRELLKSCEVYQQIASSQLSKEELENE